MPRTAPQVQNLYWYDMRLVDAIAWPVFQQAAHGKAILNMVHKLDHGSPA
jgi:hypothetical protein